MIGAADRCSLSEDGGVSGTLNNISSLRGLVFLKYALLTVFCGADVFAFSVDEDVMSERSKDRATDNLQLRTCSRRMFICWI